jgi:hypothetical protein
MRRFLLAEQAIWCLDHWRERHVTPSKKVSPIRRKPFANVRK